MGHRGLTEKEAAKRLGLSHRTLQKYRQECEPPPYVKFKTSVRYLIEDLDKFLEDNRVTPITEEGLK